MKIFPRGKITESKQEELKEKVIKWLDVQVEAVKNYCLDITKFFEGLEPQESVKIINCDLHKSGICVHDAHFIAYLLGKEDEVEHLNTGNEKHPDVYSFTYKGIKIYSIG